MYNRRHYLLDYFLRDKSGHPPAVRRNRGCSREISGAIKNTLESSHLPFDATPPKDVLFVQPLRLSPLKSWY
ncbi:unnamed protein product [Haemonchus placei]|uniref:Uncharacterized protein n=1 Tax=Haemonchus placei TaxID=6290 RepID=A0A0N4VUL7_HAEPC|nr:unnamed protein product [Haemonchus placei]